MGTTIEIQGVSVPAVGFGTWQITGPACVEAVSDALALGYRHIDTARAMWGACGVAPALVVAPGAPVPFPKSPPKHR